MSLDLTGTTVEPHSALRRVISGLDPADLVHHARQYPDVRGTERLREEVRDWHDARDQEVLVTTGGAEAVFLAVTTLVQPGDHAVLVEPAYPQLRGCLVNVGATVTTVALRPDGDAWVLDLDELGAAVSGSTRVIALINPNNPTGAVLGEADVDAVVEVAARAGCWLVVDEVCRGTERLTPSPSPGFAGRYERAVCLGSMSKTVGLPGLRIGWVVAAPEAVERISRLHEYTTIAAASPSMTVAEAVLRPEVRERLREELRTGSQEGYACFDAWVRDVRPLLSVIPPRATSAALVRYPSTVSSFEVADRLRRRTGILVAPGAFFGAEGWLRIAFGLRSSVLRPALDRLGEELARVVADHGRGGDG